MPGKKSNHKQGVYPRERDKHGRERWLIRYELPRNPQDGTRRQKAETFYGSRKDAEERLRELLVQIDQGTFLEPTNMTVAEFVVQWLKIHGPNIREITLRRYRGVVENHIIPSLGNLPLNKLTPFHIQSFYSAKVTAGRADGKEGGLKGSSIRYLHIVLHQALESAVDFGLLPSNPTRKVKVPNPQDVELEEIHPLDEDQVAQFLEAAKGSRFETLFIVALGTGLRRGELFGLKWEDIDLQNGLLTVKRTVHAVKGGLKFGPPKTKKSRRTISMPPVVVEALKKHRKEQKEEKLRLGPVYQEQGLVFPAEGSTPFHLDNIRRYFKPVLKKAGLPDIRFHDLRHTHATLLIKRGEDIKMVSERLGHSDVAFTIRVYHHVMPKVEHEAMLRFNDVLVGKKRTGEQSGSKAGILGSVN